MKNTQISNLVKCAIFAALTAVLTQIAIPLNPVPINLAVLSVFLAGGILGCFYGAMSQVVYILLGVLGLPVFSNFRSGIGVLAGPTGGYIIGYVFAAGLIGFLIKHKSHETIFKNGLSMALGLMLCYFLGTAWFSVSTGKSFIPSLLVCVVPFLLGDMIKIIAGSVLVFKINNILKQIK